MRAHVVARPFATSSSRPCSPFARQKEPTATHASARGARSARGTPCPSSRPAPRPHHGLPPTIYDSSTRAFAVPHPPRAIPSRLACSANDVLHSKKQMADEAGVNYGEFAHIYDELDDDEVKKAMAR